MSFSYYISHMLPALLLPPLNLVVTGLIGLWLGRRRPRLGRRLAGFSLAGLLVLALPFTGQRLLAGLEARYSPPLAGQADAIVVLGGGISATAPEYQAAANLHWRTLERIRYAARLYGKFGTPVLVTGGAPEGAVAEAPLMRQALEDEFDVPVAWVEARSLNTRENALYSAQLLKAAGVRRIFLVTHAWHLTRAIPEFKRQGLDVIPAGTDYARLDPLLTSDFLPSVEGLQMSFHALHEWLGLAWYSVKPLVLDAPANVVQ